MAAFLPEFNYQFKVQYIENIELIRNECHKFYWFIKNTSVNFAPIDAGTEIKSIKKIDRRVMPDRFSVACECMCLILLISQSNVHKKIWFDF